MSDLDSLIDDPIKFFQELQNRYYLKNTEISRACREIKDEHRKLDREKSKFREFMGSLADTKRKDPKEVG